MRSRGAPVEAALVVRVETWPLCHCPECIRLDLRYPSEGRQLGFWRYTPQTGPLREQR